MTFWVLAKLKKLFVAINSKESPAQLAFGAVFGLFLGLMPFVWLNVVLLFFFLLILKVNIAIAMLTWLLFKLLSFLIDPLAHSVGLYLLTGLDVLTPFWTLLYNMPIVPFTRFNNTLLLGSFVLAICLSPLVYLLFKKLIVLYRQRFLAKIETFKIVKMLKATRWFGYLMRIWGAV